MKKLVFLFVILTSVFITSCEKPIDEPIVPDVELTCTIKVDSVSTFNGTDGKITITANGGTTPYTYSKNDVDFQSSNVFNNLSAGDYTTKVKDSKNNTIDKIASVKQPNQLTATTTIVNASTYGGNGTITINVTSGTPPYTYSKDGTNFVSSNVFNLPAGVYEITIKDSKNTIKLSGLTITQPSATPLVATATTTNPLCNGGNGTITINVTSGTPPYTYSKDNTNFQESNIFNLVAGTYTITVKDTYNTITLSNNTITQPTQLTATSIKTNVLCNGGNNGSINVTTTGGTAPYTYLWSNGVTTEDLANVISDTYNVTITDANGCTTTLSNITISQPSVLSATTSVVNVTTFGGNNGSITVTANGGASPYTYTKNGTYQSSNVFSGLIAGTYTITVKDANGCTFTTSTINVTQPSLNVGDSYLGGIVFSVNTDGVSGLIAYPTTNGEMMWNPAKTTCESLGSGWRLPTYTELNTLLTIAKTNISLSYLRTGSYWSSTLQTGFTHHYKVIVIMLNGTFNTIFADSSISTNTYNSIAVKSF